MDDSHPVPPLVQRDNMLAADYVELGHRMRLLRQRLGLSLLRMAALKPDEAILSESALARYEKGRAPHPRLKSAEALDQMYQADGWIQLSLARLAGFSWSPWSESWPESEHLCSWPVDLEANVWIRILPASSGIDQEHSFLLRWGPLSRQLTTILPVQGVILQAHKLRDHDRVPRVMSISCMETLFYRVYGAGTPPAEYAENVIEINHGWERYD
jgi:hypothetical protein